MSDTKTRIDDDAVAVSHSVRATWRRILDDDDPINWMIAEFSTPSTVALAEKGRGGLPDVIPRLDPAKIQMVGLRLTLVEDMSWCRKTDRTPFDDEAKTSFAKKIPRCDVIALRSRFFGFAWFGESAALAEKHRIMYQYGRVFRKLDVPPHAWIAHGLLDVSETRVRRELVLKRDDAVARTDFRNDALMRRLGVKMRALQRAAARAAADAAHAAASAARTVLASTESLGDALDALLAKAKAEADAARRAARDAALAAALASALATSLASDIEGELRERAKAKADAARNAALAAALAAAFATSLASDVARELRERTKSAARDAALAAALASAYATSLLSGLQDAIDAARRSLLERVRRDLERVKALEYDVVVGRSILKVLARKDTPARGGVVQIKVGAARLREGARRGLYYVGKIHRKSDGTSTGSRYQSRPSDTNVWNTECVLEVANAEDAVVDVKVEVGGYVLDTIVARAEHFDLSGEIAKRKDANIVGFDTGTLTRGLSDTGDASSSLGTIEVAYRWCPYNGAFHADVRRRLPRMETERDALVAKIDAAVRSEPSVSDLVERERSDASNEADAFARRIAASSEEYNDDTHFGWRAHADRRLAVARAAWRGRRTRMRTVSVTHSRKEHLGLNFGHDEWDASTVVTSIKDYSASFKRGVRPMWTLRALDGVRCRTFHDARRALRKIGRKPAFEMRFAPSVPFCFDDVVPSGLVVTRDAEETKVTIARDALDSVHDGPRTIVAGDVMIEGVHAWNVTILDGGKDMSIRFGICDAADMNANDFPGEDKFAWAFDCRGYVAHCGRRRKEGDRESSDGDDGEPRKAKLHRLRVGDSVTVMYDMDRGLFVMDFWSVGGGIVYLYRDLKSKLKGRHLSAVFCLGESRQRIEIARPAFRAADSPGGGGATKDASS